MTGDGRFLGVRALMFAVCSCRFEGGIADHRCKCASRSADEILVTAKI